MLRGVFQDSYSVNFSISNVHMDAFGMASTFQVVVCLLEMQWWRQMNLVVVCFLPFTSLRPSQTASIA